MRKDALLIQRAAEAYAAGRPPDLALARELLRAARGIDQEFLSRTAGFPVRIEIPYHAIEPLRLRRIELGLQTAWQALELWEAGRPLRNGFGTGELESRLFRLLELYAEETQALSHSVRLPALLAPVRERLAQRLRDEMTRVARALARDASSRRRGRRA